MDDYISKPVRAAELQAALERWQVALQHLEPAHGPTDAAMGTQVVNSCAKPFGYGHATNPEIILGDPIDPATGAYSVNESWIHIYGSDPLDLRFFYNSQRLIRAEQGFGISFEAYLEKTHNRGFGYR